MMVQCPNCGHSGNLPVNMESGQHKIRCRRCGVKFETQPKETDQKVDVDPELDPKGLSDLATELGIEPEFQSDEENSGNGASDLKIDVSDNELPVPSEPRSTLPPEPWFGPCIDPVPSGTESARCTVLHQAAVVPSR
jgi:transcription elongation factor Elf1